MQEFIFLLIENYCAVTEYNIKVKLQVNITEKHLKRKLVKSSHFTEVSILLFNMNSFYSIFHLFTYVLSYVKTKCSFINRVICCLVLWLSFAKIYIISGIAGNFHILQLVKQGSISLSIISKGLVFFNLLWAHC